MEIKRAKIQEESRKASIMKNALNYTSTGAKKRKAMQNTIQSNQQIKLRDSLAIQEAERNPEVWPTETEDVAIPRVPE